MQTCLRQKPVTLLEGPLPPSFSFPFLPPSPTAGAEHQRRIELPVDDSNCPHPDLLLAPPQMADTDEAYIDSQALFRVGYR
jgi:hypothetical protein